MKPSRPLDTLFHPFENGTLAVPAEGRFLFLGAEPGYRLPEGFRAELHLVQGFRPHFRSLQGSGHAISPLPEGTGYDGALVLAGRHRGQNEERIAEAIERVIPGGLILVAGSNDDGIGSLRKRMAKLTGIEGSMPKHHGVAFWFRRPDESSALVAALRPQPLLLENRFATAPGMFSHEHIDAGSRLLAEFLPGGTKGAAADFGAGWGFLSAQLAERTTGLTSIDLYEAEFAALEAAKTNLAGLKREFGFFWHDLVGEPVARRYDLIVMNPPFHSGRAAEPAIGLAFIRAASLALNPGGSLLMVANRSLPYAQELSAGFRTVKELCDRDGFRVTLACR
jgi:16S rRNA (guanine1207-N2)-methyltransferase